ncbi:MAG: hypothetical protein GX755_01380 [Syntrophomonadaceae bacterium]|nr:hypothetical protein [Syntrophomonadaceae bacterium]
MWLAEEMINFFDFPPLQGTDNQVAVAEKIRIRILLDLIDEIARRHQNSVSKFGDELYRTVFQLIQENSIPESDVFWEISRQDWAIWWIENRFSTVADFLRYI